jgi:hypothetical protein
LRIIVNILYRFIDAVREFTDIGEEVRHIDELGILFVCVTTTVIRAINAEITHCSLSHVAALWTNDPI